LVIRINKGEVLVEGKVISSIAQGLALFVSIEKGDNDNILEEMAQKITNLRIFEDEAGKLNYSVKEKKYGILCIPNFTLCADSNKGRRPSFEFAELKDKAEILFTNLLSLLRARTPQVDSGVFGRHMDIKLEFDGPVNIIIDIPCQS